MIVIIMKIHRQLFHIKSSLANEKLTSQYFLIIIVNKYPKTITLTVKYENVLVLNIIKLKIQRLNFIYVNILILPLKIVSLVKTNITLLVYHHCYVYHKKLKKTKLKHFLK